MAPSRQQPDPDPEDALENLGSAAVVRVLPGHMTSFPARCGQDKHDSRTPMYAQFWLSKTSQHSARWFPLDPADQARY